MLFIQPFLRVSHYFDLCADVYLGGVFDRRRDRLPDGVLRELGGFAGSTGRGSVADNPVP